MSDIEVELQRRNQAGGLVAWKVADDDDSPTDIAEPVLEPVLRQRIDITISALRNAIAGTGAGAKTLADLHTALLGLEQVTVGLDQASLDALEQITAVLAAGGAVTANQGTAGSQEWAVKDQLDGFEALDDQTGNGTVRTFTFGSDVELVWVRVVGGIGRAAPAGPDPSASKGVYCAADEPTPITCVTDELRVFAPNGTTISVWGFRRA